MSFRITINRPKPRRYTAIAQTRTQTSNPKSTDVSVSLTGRLDQQYGNRILQLLLSCCDTSTPVDTFNRIYFFVVFFPIIWFAIVSEAISSICRTSRYPTITILLSEVFLLTCLARYTAVVIVLSAMIGGVALSVHPIIAGTKLLFPFVNDRLSSLEIYFAQRAGSLQTLLEDIKMLFPMWIEDEWCEVTQKDDSKILSGDRPALLPPSPVKENPKTPPPPRMFPKVTFEIPPQAPKPDFNPEGWLLV